MKSAYQDTVEEVKNLKGIEEAIALAIEREKEARDFYMQQAALMENPKFKELYEHLAGEEVKHLGYLEGYRDKKELPTISTEVPSGQSFSPEFDPAGQKGERSPLEMQHSSRSHEA
ncbi:ferritin family protein [Methanosarcina horonobensis]|uniref:ferritin family protein n=1 Tax=Methanosarcina horonobensis TaxID=418008 RepID=UPI000A707E47|nr:ferritin family protein [Methanosarcina horonobensis]